MITTAAAEFSFYAHEAEEDDFYRAVIDGFRENPRSIAPKFFYDQEGSRLFAEICELPEYYPTRTEKMLLEDHAAEISVLAGDGCFLVEPGSGNCDKVRTLLESLRPAAYVPLDISCEHLQLAAADIARMFPWLDVHAVCTDITAEVSLPFIPADAARMVFYPGSSIGNYDPLAAVELLADLAGIAGPAGSLLIGVDLRKDHAILNAAYNDSQGVTAAFNLNLLQRINRELGGNFDLKAFEHHAFYSDVAGRVEMHLISLRRQTVTIDGHRFEFNAGDNIHTENSYKYTVTGFQQLAADAGFEPCAVWCDAAGLFSLHFLRVR
jgi:dimethylhistidine N-methyltransferase